MAHSNVKVYGPERRQWQDVADAVIEAEFLFDPPNINSNGFYQEDITMNGLVYGDIVLGVSFDQDIQNVDIRAHVKQDNVLSVHVKNNTAGAIDLGQNQCHVLIVRPVHRHRH